MRYLKYSPTFLDPMGFPVDIPDPDRRKFKQARLQAIEDGRKRGLKDTEILFDQPIIEGASFAQVMVYLANGIPWNKGEKAELPTPEDTGNALKVIRAFQNQKNGYVAIEDKPLEWLVELNKEDGNRAFNGPTQALIAERLADVFEGVPPEVLTRERGS